MKTSTLTIFSFFAFATGGESADADSSTVNLLTGEGVSVGGVLFPSVSFQSAFGTSTADPGELLSGHHDPDREGFTVQNVEFSLTAKLSERLSLFGTYAAKIDLDDRWQGSFEEYYATLSGLPLGATFKGGRFLPHFGFHNQNHPHDFTMLDQHIASGRILGDDGIRLYGGEIYLPVLRSLSTGWEDQLVFAFGKTPVAEEEEHGHEKLAFEAEGGLFNDWAATAHYGLTFAATSNTLHTFGAFGAWGDNRSGLSTQIYGTGYEYLWRAEGSLRQPHHEQSEFVKWRTEAFTRCFGAVSAAEARRDFTDFAAYSVLTYGVAGGKWQAHLRGEYASGIADAGLPERWRVSPAVTWIPPQSLSLNWKLQYNYDHSPSFGDEHSVWLQFNLHWGAGCAHAH